MDKKQLFNINKFKNENNLNFKPESYDFEKYKLLYLAFGKKLNKNQYEFCRQNGNLYRIIFGYDIKVLDYNWLEQY